MSQRDWRYVYVGTYTRPQGNGEGLYMYRLRMSDGSLEYVGTVTDVVNPSYLTVSADRRYLYAASEVSTFEGQDGGGVSAFAINGQNGQLTLLNQQPTHGGAPCYVSVAQSGGWLLAANYSGGSVTVLPIDDGGRLGAATAVVQHHGSSVNPERQQEPHAHSVVLDPSNQYALVADLGIDQILSYQLDAKGTLTPHTTVATTPGAGPRHLAFHQNGRYLYCANELDSSVTLFSYDPAGATLQALQTASTLPPEFTGVNTCAHIQIAPSGTFLYVSNRGHDSLAIFAIDAATGALTAAGHAATGGQTPRHFAIDPDGTWLLAANQQSDNVVTFRLDGTSGALVPVQTTTIPTPVCLHISR